MCSFANFSSSSGLWEAQAWVGTVNDWNFKSEGNNALLPHLGLDNTEVEADLGVHRGLRREDQLGQPGDVGGVGLSTVVSHRLSPAGNKLN